MRPLPAVFQSRVGRRLLLQFLVIALLPLAALAIVSLSQVRDLLLAQGSARLATVAKTYAMGVHERLQTARDLEILSAATPGRSSLDSASNTRRFLSMSRFQTNGKVDVLWGTLPPDAASLVASYRGRSREAPTALRRSDGGRLFLLHAMDAGSSDILAGELDPEYVWGAEAEVRAGTVLCVVEGESLAELRCLRGHAASLSAFLKDRAGGIESRDFNWQDGGDSYRGRVWAQFMAHDFAAPDWYFALSAREDEMLGVVSAFGTAFVSTVVLALLLIAWLTIRQLRTTLVPLQALGEGTRRLAANDLDARVAVESADEFGELGDAFNTMAERLGTKFRLSVAYSEIDRLILEREALDRIVEATLRHASVLVPGARFRILFLDGAGSSSAKVVTLEADRVVAERIEVSNMPFSFLPGTESGADGTTPPWMTAGTEHGPGSRWMQPLIWGKTACGWLLAFGAADRELDDEAIRTIGGLANRLAVAIASAWRDVELFQRAHYDSLTGLPNRDLFGDRLRQEVARCRRDGNAFAVMFLDLDHFKGVNDSHGHGAGDRLLCEAAERLREALREGDTVCRHGGDEFTVLATGVREQGEVMPIAQKIIDAMSQPFLVDDQACFLSASIGIAIHPDNGDSADELLKHADTAMYRAKAAGRRCAMFFEERMNAEAVARLAIDRELRRALERNELVLHYQPQVELKRDRVVAAEALVRWNHPERGLLSPGHFIPVAEQSDLIAAVGRWAMEEACRQMLAWRRQVLPLERVSVNVSARQFTAPDFIEHVRATVVEPGLTANIEFEITESVLLEHGDELVRKLAQLSELGCSIALDDFGTGFSSLAYLKRLPVHAVKIDRMFVEDIDLTSDARALVEAMIAMSHVLGKWVVAEGAERETQVSILQGLGCDLVQGYCFAKPLPAAELATFVKDFVRREWGVVAAVAG
ncbi:MAG: EAL domain-containing protein [Burkholderiales bacterium]|nr:EAL domain-containing protein [Burkholderiales bacterium]